MYTMALGSRFTDVPDVGGLMTQWHIHYKRRRASVGRADGAPRATEPAPHAAGSEFLLVGGECDRRSFECSRRGPAAHERDVGAPDLLAPELEVAPPPPVVLR